MPRRHASIHASMDSQRSKQLLSQWKTKNENRKLSLQVGRRDKHISIFVLLFKL